MLRGSAPPATSMVGSGASVVALESANGAGNVVLMINGAGASVIALQSANGAGLETLAGSGASQVTLQSANGTGARQPSLTPPSGLMFELTSTVTLSWTNGDSSCDTEMWYTTDAAHEEWLQYGEDAAAGEVTFDTILAPNPARQWKLRHVLDGYTGPFSDPEPESVNVGTGSSTVAVQSANGAGTVITPVTGTGSSTIALQSANGAGARQPGLTPPSDIQFELTSIVTVGWTNGDSSSDTELWYATDVPHEVWIQYGVDAAAGEVTLDTILAPNTLRQWKLRHVFDGYTGAFSEPVAETVNAGSGSSTIAPQSASGAGIVAAPVTGSGSSSVALVSANGAGTSTEPGPNDTAPSALWFDETGGGDTIVNWTNGDSSAESRVERSNNGVSGWTLQGTVAAGVETFTSSLAFNGSRWWRVRHFKDGLYGPYSTHTQEAL